MSNQPTVEDDYGHLKKVETDVFIAGSGPIGATFCRQILEKHPSARVFMAEIGSQDNPVIGAHHKNSIKYQKDIDAFVNVIKGALQHISMPPADTHMDTLGEVGWTPAPGQNLIQSYHNPNQDPRKNLLSYMTRTVGGMATHWTCACPLPDPQEREQCPIDGPEFDNLLSEAKLLLNVNENEYDESIRHNLVKDVLTKVYGPERVKNLPLAVKRRENKEFVTWSGVDTVLGRWATEQDPRFVLKAETRVTKLILDPVPGPRKVVGALCRDLNTHEDFVVLAKHYVVACGAVGTPQVLFNSKIRPPLLGKNLTEQSLAFCQIVLKREYIDSIPTRFPELVKKHQSKHSEDPMPIPFSDPEPQVTMPYSSALGKQYHVQIHRDAFSYGDVGPRADPRVVVDLRFFGRQEIREENCVTFADPITIQRPDGTTERNMDGTTDGYGMPQATFHVTRSASDAERDHQMMKDMCEAASVLGAYLPGSQPQFMAPGLVLHITGTTRAGSSSEDSVVDQNSKLWDLDNVFVGGNNVIPDSTACNPTLTSVAYAIKSARYISSQIPV
ncbi:GMC oxidoreductase [Ceratobasidium sp. AG-Ba]|nr:GMC oxidoreductase [Ceratobasidium sp. AG-Ba]